MKKIVSTLVFGALLASTANADFLRVEAGLGAWSQDSSGELSYSKNSLVGGSDISKENSFTNAYAWMIVKHPIPLVPNLRLEYAQVKNDGLASGTFNDFSATPNTTTTMKIKEYDIIPYYNILDNTFWATLDLGVDIKILDIDYRANGVTINSVINQNYNDSKTVAIPLGYARTRVEIPATNIGLEADVKYITYDGSTVYDNRIKADYTFDMFPVVQPAVEVGYRMQKIDVKTDSDKTKIDLKFSGFYAGLMVRF